MKLRQVIISIEIDETTSEAKATMQIMDNGKPAAEMMASEALATANSVINLVQNYQENIIKAVSSMEVQLIAQQKKEEAEAAQAETKKPRRTKKS